MPKTGNPPDPIWRTVTRPTLLVDKKKVIANIGQMAARAAAGGARFRPHFKTHQSPAVGEWFRKDGVTAIAVSSLAMARYFADHGWADICVALVVNPLAMQQIEDLARRVELHLLVDSPAAVTALAGRRGVEADIQVWIKIDAGYGRTGIPSSDTAAVLSLARRIPATRGLAFAGLLSHSGQTYAAAGPDEIRAIHEQVVSRLTTLQHDLAAAGCEPGAISLGDTPSCSVVDSFAGIDEIRPGCFVFGDLMQLRLGACRPEDIAVAVACPVIGKYPDRQEIVLHGGAVHLGEAFLPARDGDPPEGPSGAPARFHGYLAAVTSPAGEGWEGPDRRYPVIRISQEHGIVRADGDLLARTEIGDVLPVLPVHSCLTCNLFPGYLTLQGGWLERRRSNDVPREAE